MESRGSRDWENWAISQGFSKIAGVDEVGRGPLAGPVVACACLLPLEHSIIGIDDSKKLTARDRKKVFEQLVSDPFIVYAVGIVEASVIDEINILQASFQAMRIAIEKLTTQPDFILVDGHQLIPRMSIAQKAIIGGDAISESIGAASIIAKEIRDEIMVQIHERWPMYGFNKHKGYATKAHLEAIRAFGPCNEHRKSFEPIKSYGKEELVLDLIF